MKTLGRIYYVLAIVVGVVLCLVIVRELVRSGALREVWSAWPVFLMSAAAAGLVLYYFYRRGKPPDNPYRFDLAMLIALLAIAAVVVAVAVIGGMILYALGLFPGI